MYTPVNMEAHFEEGKIGDLRGDGM